MKLVIGLGNPERKYSNTRHNVGFMVVDRLVGDQQWKESKGGKLLYTWIKVDGKKVELIKPTTFMNLSGRAVFYAKRKHPELELEDMFVVHDDLDIPLGKYKIQLGKGPRQHGGLTSIYQSIGSNQFWHVRIGIENRVQEISGEEYVLQRFTREEREVVDRVIEEVVEELRSLVVV